MGGDRGRPPTLDHLRDHAHQRGGDARARQFVALGGFTLVYIILAVTLVWLLVRLGGSRCRSWRPRPDHRCRIHRTQTRTPAMPWPDPQNQLAFLNGAILLLGVLLYALLGGADFGAASGTCWRAVPGGRAAQGDRQCHRSHLGGESCLADLRHRARLHRLSACFRRAQHRALHSALAGAAGDRLSWGRLHLPHPGPQRRHRRRRLGPRLRRRQHRHPGLLRHVRGGGRLGQIRLVSGMPVSDPWRTWLAPFPLAIGLLASPPAPISPPSI